MSELSTVEAIRKHLRNPRVKLTAEQETLWKRIDHAWALLVDTRQVRTDVEKVDALRHIYNVGKTTAYNYLGWAKDLYGDLQEGKKSAHRAIVYAYAQETFRKAMLTDNASAMAAIVGQMVKIFGLDRDEVDTPDFSNIEPPTVVLGLPEESKQQLLLLVQAGVIDLNNTRPTQVPQDVEYIELPADAAR